jgi:Glycine zipper
MKTNALFLMKKTACTLAAAVAAVTVTGCYNPDGTQNNTATGALAGGAFGAATGAIIGGASHNAGAGALIGAGAGSLLGALVGNSADQQQRARLQQQAPATYQRAQQGTPLSLNDVKALSKAGLSDDTIISQITLSHTVYHVGATDIIDLHENGVSQPVIDFIVNTPTTVTVPTTDVAVATAPPPPPMDVVTVSPDPGYVWIGGEWVWNGGWYWRAGYWGAPLYPGYIYVGGYWGHGRYYPGHWGRR